MASRPNLNQCPSWSINGNSSEDIPPEPNHWDKFIEAEHLEDKDLKNNPKVLSYILKIYEDFYVPTKVLKMYGISDQFDA